MAVSKTVYKATNGTTSYISLVGTLAEVLQALASERVTKPNQIIYDSGAAAWTAIYKT